MQAFINSLQLAPISDKDYTPAKPVNLLQCAPKDRAGYLVQQAFMFRLLDFSIDFAESKFGAEYKEKLKSECFDLKKLWVAISADREYLANCSAMAELLLNGNQFSDMDMPMFRQVMDHRTKITNSIIPRTIWQSFVIYHQLVDLARSGQQLPSSVDIPTLPIITPFLDNDTMEYMVVHMSLHIPTTQPEIDLLKRNTIFSYLSCMIWMDRDDMQHLEQAMSVLTFTREKLTLRTFLKDIISHDYGKKVQSPNIADYHIDKRLVETMFQFLTAIRTQGLFVFKNQTWFGELLRVMAKMHSGKEIQPYLEYLSEGGLITESALEALRTTTFADFKELHNVQTVNEHTYFSITQEAATEDPEPEEETPEDTDDVEDTPEDDTDESSSDDTGDQSSSGDEPSDEPEETEEDTHTDTVKIGSLEIQLTSGKGIPKTEFNRALLRNTIDTVLIKQDQITAREVVFLKKLRYEWLYLLSVDTIVGLLKKVFGKRINKPENV